VSDLGNCPILATLPNNGKVHQITVKMCPHSSLYVQPSAGYSVLKLETERSYFWEKCIWKLGNTENDENTMYELDATSRNTWGPMKDTFPLPYLSLQTGSPNKVSRRTRIDGNWQFGTFIDISTSMLQIDVSIWYRPRMEKPMISREKEGFKEQIWFFYKINNFLPFFCFFLRYFKKYNRRSGTFRCRRSHIDLMYLIDLMLDPNPILRSTISTTSKKNQLDGDSGWNQKLAKFLGKWKALKCNSLWAYISLRWIVRFQFHQWGRRGGDSVENVPAVIVYYLKYHQ